MALGHPPQPKEDTMPTMRMGTAAILLAEGQTEIWVYLVARETIKIRKPQFKFIIFPHQ